MPEYDDTNRGVLFRNDKGGNEKRPDYTGEINVDGKELRLAAWLRESKKGTKFLSLSVSAKDPRPDVPVEAPKEASNAQVDDEIPF